MAEAPATAHAVTTTHRQAPGSPGPRGAATGSAPGHGRATGPTASGRSALLVTDRADAAGRAPGDPGLVAGPGTGIRLLLPARALFDGAGVLAFLGTRALPGVELAGPGTYARTLRLPHGAATVEPEPRRHRGRAPTGVRGAARQPRRPGPAREPGAAAARPRRRCTGDRPGTLR
ncbi:AlkA N-terminal domain-containing protein [Cryobacterium breve]|uniref:AlkA N-terminal domain-containing protein n=1 Tax=Cryobacterium breve TaxID=1259258 RepID=UPI003D7C30AA